MSVKLKEHLARRKAEALSPLLGPQALELIRHVGPEAEAPEVMADLLIRRHGAAFILRDAGIRRMLIDALDIDDVQDLCTVLGLGSEAPRMKVSNVNFGLLEREMVLFEWYAVPHRMAVPSEDLSCNLSSAEKLSLFQEPAYRQIRRFLNEEACGMLVRMPFGAGKMRTVATAVLENFRSEAEGKSVLWLAPGECLCGEVARELTTVWGQIGLRDVTSYRLYGRASRLPPEPLSNAIVVADVEWLAREVSDPDRREAALATLELLGSSLRHVVLSEAENALLPAVQSILQALGRNAAWHLVGISSFPGLAAMDRSEPLELVAAYANNVVELDHEAPLEALRGAGAVDAINVRAIPSPLRLDCRDDWIFLPSDEVEKLAVDVERCKGVLDKLHELAHAGQLVVFHAATAQQARMFAGLLSLKGVASTAVTSESEISQDEIAQFGADRRNQILCVHGVLVSSGQVQGVTACVLGLPSLSGALLYEMVGRLASGRNAPEKPLQVYAVRDQIPRYLRLVDALDKWDRLASRS